MMQGGEPVHIPLIDVGLSPDQALHYQDSVIGDRVAGALDIPLCHILSISKSMHN